MREWRPKSMRPKTGVILASFGNRRAAEHMLASLGRGFREKHRKGHATALVISGNKDGSLRQTQSRVLTASGFVYTLLRVGLSWMIGFLGLFSTLRGGKGAAAEARKHQSHVGSDEQAGHAILARVGPDAALVLVCCDDEETRQAVVRQAAELGNEVGLARARSSSPLSIPAASTTGCAPPSASPPDRRQSPVGPTSPRRMAPVPWCLLFSAPCTSQPSRQLLRPR